MLGVDLFYKLRISDLDRSFVSILEANLFKDTRNLQFHLSIVVSGLNIM